MKCQHCGRTTKDNDACNSCGAPTESQSLYNDLIPNAFKTQVLTPEEIKGFKFTETTTYELPPTLDIRHSHAVASAKWNRINSLLESRIEDTSEENEPVISIRLAIFFFCILPIILTIIGLVTGKIV